MSCCLEADTDAHKKIWMGEEKKWAHHSKWIKWSTLADGVYGLPGADSMNFAAEHQPNFVVGMPWVNMNMSIIGHTSAYKTVRKLCFYCLNVCNI